MMTSWMFKSCTGKTDSDMEPNRRSEYSDEGIIMDTQKKKAQLEQANGEK